jgi:hypothetical protein
MTAGRAEGNPIKCRFSLIKTAITALLLFTPALSALTPDDTGCIRWRDSLIVAGIRSLDQHNASAAQRYFTAAYECGMSKDSMCYFAAEIYLCRFAVDTALSFNRALEQSPTFSKELRSTQLARIYRLVGSDRQADSLMALTGEKGKDRYDISLSVSGVRSILALNTFVVLPQDISLSIDPDIEDIGRSNLLLRWSRPRYRKIPPLSILFTMNSDWAVPTRYFFDEASDTLMQSYAFSMGIGDVSTMPEFMTGYRMRLHADGKTDHYDRERISVSIGKQRLMSVGHEAKWIGGQGVDDNREDVAFMSFFSGKKSRHNWALSLSHHFAKSFMYRDRLDSTGLFRPLALGFADSLLIGDTTEPYYHLYRDRNHTTPYVIDENIALPDMRAYWNGQPDIYFSVLPEHDINASLRYGCKFLLPFEFSISMQGSVTGAWYPKKVRWFSVDSDTLVNGDILSNLRFSDLYTECAIIYNAADGKYYLNRVRTDYRYFASSLTQLHYYEKTRIDGYFMMSALVEKSFGNYGTLFFSAAFSKGVSTMKENEPVVTFDYAWEFSAGWKKDLFILQ